MGGTEVTAQAGEDVGRLLAVVFATHELVDLTVPLAEHLPCTWPGPHAVPHLLEGRVWPTLEVIIREAPAELRKTYRPDVGLALIDLERS